MDIKKAQQNLWKAVYKLKATSSSGFEGFLAAALREITEQAFHTVKAGPQGGSDVRSDPCNLVHVALESKKYKPDTRLPVKELLQKLTDASLVEQPPDLWIVAATREIDSGDREKIQKCGERLGIHPVVWDWKREDKDLSDLAVICGSAPISWASYLGQSNKLKESLRLIREHDDFESRKRFWRTSLLRPNVGYANCRQQCIDWLGDAQESLASAKSRLGGPNNLNSSKYGVVRRNDINKQLQTWFSDRSAGLCALIGTEGMGKSWAVLDWCNELAQSTDTESPIIVFLKARSIVSTNAKSEIANSISTQVDYGSNEFWRRRLDLWERRTGDYVRVLVVVDGLNQRFKNVDWAEWVQPLFEDSVRSMYRVLFTCWQTFWRDELFGLANLEPKSITIDVKVFDDEEFDELLSRAEVRKEDLSGEVLQMMRVPRLSILALDHRERLAESGDVTAERLIYEDWKDRISRTGSHVGLDDSRMKVFIERLGHQLRQNVNQAINRSNIIQILLQDSGKIGSELTLAVGHLTSGGWFKEGDRPDTFKLEPDRIHYVLGAALISELKGKNGSLDLHGTIADFLDPLRAHSLAARILRASTTIALVEVGTSADLRQELVERWLDEQNFSNEDSAAFWRLAGIDASLFLNTAERTWLSARSDHFKDEVLIKTLAKAANRQHFHNLLKSRLIEWLSTAWCDTLESPNQKTERVVHDSSVEVKEIESVRARTTDWSNSSLSSEFVPVQFSKQGDWFFLGHRALGVLSYRPRKPYKEVFEAWALSRALMPWPEHINDVAWLIRMNVEDLDQANVALCSVIEHLEGIQHETARRAANFLRDVLSHPGREDDERDFEECAQISYHEETKLVIEEFEGDALFEEVQRFLTSLNLKCYNAIEEAVLIDKLIVESGLPAAGKEMDLLSRHFREIVTIISPKSRCLLKNACEREQKLQPHHDKSRPLGAATTVFMSLILGLYDASTREQSKLLLESKYSLMNKQWDEWLGILHTTQTNDRDDLNIARASQAGLRQWVYCVGRLMTKQSIQDLAFLPSLILDQDVGVRTQAVLLAARGEHVEALLRFSESRYASPTRQEDESNFHEEHARNVALITLESIGSCTTPDERLTDQAAALRVKTGDHSIDAMEAFGAYLIHELQQVVSSFSWSTRRYWFKYSKCIKLVFEHKGSSFVEQVGVLAERAASKVEHAFMTDFPVLSTMRVLKEESPSTALSIYRKLKERAPRSFLSTSVIDGFPFELPECDESDTACVDEIHSAITDKQLLDIAYFCHKNKRASWLLEQIVTLEQRERPADLAKAFTLLGFCDITPEADVLWKEFSSRQPQEKWLHQIFETSREEYCGHYRVRAAIETFWHAEFDAAAWFTLRQLVRECDSRIVLWINEFGPTCYESAPRSKKLAWKLLEKEINGEIKKDFEKRKKLLFHTDLPISYMAPWN